MVDSSAVVSALLDAGAEGSRIRARVAGHNLEAPDILVVEACNVLRRLEISGTISGQTAAAAFADLRAFPISFWPSGLLADRIWELRGSVTSYDAAFVALAEKLSVPLLTLDARLASAPGPRCAFLTGRAAD